MRRLVIAIDCDDVLVDTAHDLINFYNEKYNTNISEADFYSNTDETLKRLGVDSLTDAIVRFNERLYSSEHQLIAPTDETIAAVSRLASNHELHLVTGRQYALERATIMMINRYFSNVFTTIEHTNYITDDIDAVKRTKGEVCRSIDADVMIDDLVAHLDDVISSGTPYAILFGDFEWGRRNSMPSNTVQCKDWTAVEREIARIADNDE